MMRLLPKNNFGGIGVSRHVEVVVGCGKEEEWRNGKNERGTDGFYKKNIKRWILGLGHGSATAQRTMQNGGNGHNNNNCA